MSNQLKAIDYIMGRESAMPEFFTTLDRRSPSVRTRDAALQLKEEMASSDILIRATFLNSLFKGQSQLAKTENRAALIDYLMTAIVPENKEIAKTLAHALIEAEGANSSLILSAILAEQPEKGAKAVTEQGMLKVMLEAYGVPGVKLAQYLAFTGEFKEYEAVLAKYQDSAPTPGYFDILSYIESEVRGLLDTTKFKFTRLLGAGSVNLAIEYYDIEKKTFSVFNIPREHIMQKSKLDFARFQILMKKLAARSTEAMDFSYLVGLSQVIEDSVKLEFDRQAVIERQNDAKKIYAERKIDGWKLQTVGTDGRYNSAILMGLAPGKTARKIFESKPEMYRETLRLVYDYEFDLMFKPWV
ncbi:MAG: hypothetical protein EOP06_28620, partial [Proteobacteria bacterium]